MHYLMINLSLFVIITVTFLSCNNKQKTSEDKTTQTQQAETTANEPKSSEGVVLFFGTSLTAGMGLEKSEAYPALIQQKIDSLDLSYTVVNAGLSGETTAGGKNRLDWVLQQEIAVFVLELGANDGLRGIPLSETKKNLQTIIDRVHAKNENTTIVIAGMQLPPNMGADYTQEFRQLFPDLAQENDLVLIPFLLDGVGGIPELNQEDGIHPTAKGQKIIAETVWEVIKPIL